MYLTFEKFHSFVVSLQNFNEMEINLSHSLGYMHQVKEKNKFIKRDLRMQNMKIIRKVKARKNMKDILYIMQNLLFMRNIFKTINDDLNREEFGAAIDNFISFKSIINSLGKTIIWKHFARIESILIGNLTDFFKSNFENSFITYFNGSFEYNKPSMEASSQQELDMSLSYSYIFDNEDFQDFSIEFTRCKDTEAHIVRFISNLLKISNLSLKNFQSKLIEFYANNNKQLKSDIFNYIASNRNKLVKNSQFLNLCKFYFNVHFYALRKVLTVFKRIVVWIFDNYFAEFSTLEQIVTSKYFAIIENLYGIFLLMLNSFMSHLKSFFEDVKDVNVNISELMNMENLLSEIQQLIKKDIYDSLFPKKLPKNTSEEIFRKFTKNIRYNFNINDFNKFCFELLDFYLLNFHSKNIYCMQRLLENEDWGEINISYDLREKVLTLLPQETACIVFENTRISINDKFHYISRSLEFLIITTDTYIKMISKHNQHSHVIKNMVVDMFQIFNKQMFSIILSGGCLEFGVIKRIDIHLLVALLKELDFVLKSSDNLFATKTLIDLKRKDNLKNEIEKHQESLRVNIQVFIRQFFKDSVVRLNDYNWKEPSFKFLTPSVEACNIVGFINDNLKRLKKYLTTNELYPYYIYIKSELMQEYVRHLDRFAEISPDNKSYLASEKNFIISSLAEIEKNLEEI
jgi:hypothetical protein